MRIFSLLLIFILLPALSCVTVERTIETTPQPMSVDLEGQYWHSLPVAYCVVLGKGFVDQARFVSLIRDAFTVWGVEVLDEGTCTESVEGNARNEISWGVPPEQPGDIHEAAYTRLRVESCSGPCPQGNERRITEADIVIHPSPPDRFRSSRCLFMTLLHETGHFLGVPHSDNPGVMAPISNTCHEELSDQDRAALAALYP